MAGQKTTLITGSNAKIVINGITLAYATDFQYGVAVDTVPVEVMGRYEVLSNEPISYTVAGSFSVVRYTKAAQAANLQGAAANGNGVGEWAASGGQPVSQQLNPSQILTSQTVDLQLYRKTQNAVTAGSAGSGTGAEIIKTITDARVTRMGGSINKRGVLVEQFHFVAILSGDDSFVAGNSGELDLD